MLKYNLEQLQVSWMDSAKVARRWWTKYAKRGYGLKNVANDLGIEFDHHDALEDARATALIMLRVLNESELGIQKWLEKTASGRSRPRETITYEDLPGKIDGYLQGETLVFTGVLTMKRDEATQKAVQAGCVVVSSVSKRTSILVVGVQDKHKLNGMTKSNKHRRAEEMIALGYDIQIISEQDFLDVIGIVSLKHNTYGSD